MYGYVYLTTNKINGMKYIGQHHTNQFDDHYLGSGKLIKEAIQKYGKQNFNVKILKICYSRDELNDFEKYFIDKYGADLSSQFYNICTGGLNSRGRRSFNNPRYGINVSSDTRQKISKSNLGKQRSEEWKVKHRGENSSFYNHTHTEDWKSMMSKQHTGVGNPMWNKSSWNKGLKMSLETKQKLSNSRKGKYVGELSPCYGIPRTDEVKLKISESRKGKYIGRNNPNSKKIYCSTLNIVFDTVQEASKYFNISTVTLRKYLKLGCYKDNCITYLDNKEI